METELSLNNILNEAEVESLFTSDPEHSEENLDMEEEIDSEEIKEPNVTKEKQHDTVEVNPEELFEDKPESVDSSIEDIKKGEDTLLTSDSTSPNNFYSSIAKALKEEGVFPDLDDSQYSKIKEPADFKELIEAQIKAGLDTRQKRIDEALGIGITPDEITTYDNTISYLDSIDEDKISEESESGETLRKQLIYQDFINRGYSKERAQREVGKSIQAGSDIEDAKEALESNIEYFNEGYSNLIEEAKRKEQKQNEERLTRANALKKSILEDKQVFGELSVDKQTRLKVYDNISKPIYKHPESGNYLTAIQKYEIENQEEFLKNVGVIFTLTDGFKNLDGLVKTKVKKEVGKGLKDLERTLNNTSRNSDGSLKFVSSVEEDPESFIGKGWDLDV